MDKSHCAGAHMITFFFNVKWDETSWDTDRRETVQKVLSQRIIVRDFIASKRDRCVWFGIIIVNGLIVSVVVTSELS